jgi:SAM-dependent methyltransferase
MSERGDSTLRRSQVEYLDQAAASRAGRDYKEVMLEAMRVRPGHRVLDLGCGPGTLTLPLARYCGTMIGMDADPAMIAAAAQAAQIAGVPIEWRVGSSFDLAEDLAPLHLVTIARAFHWMDREATLGRLDELIEPDGVVALVNTELHPRGAMQWHKPFEELRNAHGRFDDFYRWRKSGEWEEHPSVLLRSAFSDVERISVFEARTANIEEIVARALSFSANSPAALGADGHAAYEAEVRERMLAIAPDGNFPEIVESIAIIARRPAG